MSNQNKNTEKTQVINKNEIAKKAQNAKVAKQAKMKKWKVAIYTFAMLVISGALIVGAVGSFYVWNIIKSTDPYSHDRLVQPDATRIYDKDGGLITELGTHIRENVSYDEFPQVLIDSVISIEDSRFYSHNGFDIPRIVKSAMEVVLNRSVQGAGGSTITQQLMKTSYFNDFISEKGAKEKVDRKIAEIYLAIQADKDLSKEEILELYLNGVYFGGPAWGIEKAAEYYFNKDVSQLTLPESALLAGIINRPGTLNPYQYLDNATKRQHTVLNLMHYHGYITKEEAQAAKAIPVESLLSGKSISEEILPYQSYVDVVISQVIEETGFNPYTVPMEIYTYLDRTAQDAIEGIMRGDNPNVPWVDHKFDAGISLQESTTGRIVAIGGGRAYVSSGGERLFNLAYDQKRQPGSTIKPIMIYAPAFDALGYSTGHVFNESTFTYNGWSPQNADRRAHPNIDLLTAVANSYNIPAASTYVKMMNKVGSEALINQMKSLGLEQELDPIQWGPAYSLGGFTHGVTPVELAAAFATLANSGSYIKPHTIDRIVFKHQSKEDTVQYIDSEIAPQQIYSPGAAYMMSEILKGAASGNYLDLPKAQVPGLTTYIKSGTSDHGEQGVPEFNIPPVAPKDKLNAGYTADYAMAVWTGYPVLTHEVPATYIEWQAPGSSIPGFGAIKYNTSERIFAEVMKAVHPDRTTSRTITRPDSVKEARIVRGLFPYRLASSEISSSIVGLFADPKWLPKQFLERPSITPLSGFNATLNGQMLNVSFAGYTPEDQTSPGDPNNVDDLRNIHGFIQYMVVLKDATTKAILVDPMAYGHEYHSSINIAVPDHVLNTRNFEVCGYYQYSIDGTRSNEECRSFAVADKTPPVINNLNRSFSINVGDTIPDILSGVQAIDDVDGDVSNTLEVIGMDSVDSSKPGTYTVIVRASDKSGNTTNDNDYRVTIVVN